MYAWVFFGVLSFVPLVFFDYCKISIVQFSFLNVFISSIAEEQFLLPCSSSKVFSLYLAFYFTMEILEGYTHTPTHTVPLSLSLCLSVCLSQMILTENPLSI